VREYGKIYSKIWASTDFRALSEDGQKLALYLLTSGHATMLGCYFLPDGYICEDIGWSSDRLRDAMADCIAKSFVERDVTSRWVFVTRFLKWNKFENTKVAVGARNRFDAVPDIFKFKLANAILEHCPKHLPDEHVQTYTAQKPFVMSDAYEQAVAESQAKALTVDAPAKPVKPKAPSEGKTPAQKAAATKEANTESKTAATWAAYTEAYVLRYKVKPLRDKQANSLMLQFVEKVGVGDAPHIAVFFVKSHWQLAVSGCHAVIQLLKYADKFRVEWSNSGEPISKFGGCDAVEQA
jgi:hypothetical protein